MTGSVRSPLHPAGREFSPGSASWSHVGLAWEACATVHHWGREIGALGHEVKLLAA